jgi:hypothetical protein
MKLTKMTTCRSEPRPKSRPRPRVRPTDHARYLIWATKARSAANRDKRFAAEPLMGHDAFHAHLYFWGVTRGLIVIPENAPHDRSASAEVAAVFAKNPEVVKAEARRYWRALVRLRSQVAVDSPS